MVNHTITTITIYHNDVSVSVLIILVLKFQHSSLYICQFMKRKHVWFINRNMQQLWQYFQIIFSIKNTYLGFMVPAGYCPILIQM